MKEFPLGFISCHRRLEGEDSENSGFESDPQALVLSKLHDFSQDASLVFFLQCKLRDVPLGQFPP